MSSLPEITLREWLKECRETAQLTQSDVDRLTRAMGERYRVSQSYLSQIEKGTRPFTDLKPEKMDALRQVYGFSRSEWTNITGVVLMTPKEAIEAENASSKNNISYEISSDLRAAIEVYGDQFPNLLKESVKQKLSLAQYYGESRPKTPQEWLAYYMSIAKWIE